MEKHTCVIQLRWRRSLHQQPKLTNHSCCRLHMIQYTCLYMHKSKSRTVRGLLTELHLRPCSAVNTELTKLFSVSFEFTEETPSQRHTLYAHTGQEAFLLHYTGQNSLQTERESWVTAAGQIVPLSLASRNINISLNCVFRLTMNGKILPFNCKNVCIISCFVWDIKSRGKRLKTSCWGMNWTLHRADRPWDTCCCVVSAPHFLEITYREN